MLLIIIWYYSIWKCAAATSKFLVFQGCKYSADDSVPLARGRRKWVGILWISPCWAGSCQGLFLMTALLYVGIHLWCLSMRLFTEHSKVVGFCVTTTWVMFLYMPFCMCLARSSCSERSKWMGKEELVQFQTKKDQHSNKVETLQEFLWGMFCGESIE